MGLACLLLLAYLVGEDRRRISWRTVVGGVGLQIAFALLLIGVPGTDRAMFWLNDAANALHSATLTGTQFVFGYLGGGAPAFAETHPGASFILAHEPRIANDVGGEDRSEATGGGHCSGTPALRIPSKKGSSEARYAGSSLTALQKARSREMV